MRLYRGPSAVPGRRARLGSTLPRGRRCILAAYLKRKERAVTGRVAGEGGCPTRETDGSRSARCCGGDPPLHEWCGGTMGILCAMINPVKCVKCTAEIGSASGGCGGGMTPLVEATIGPPRGSMNAAVANADRALGCFRFHRKSSRFNHFLDRPAVVGSEIAVFVLTGTSQGHFAAGGIERRRSHRSSDTWSVAGGLRS